MPDPDSALEQTVCMTGTASPTLVTTVWYMETGMVTSCPETGNARVVVDLQRFNRFAHKRTRVREQEFATN